MVLILRNVKKAFVLLFALAIYSNVFAQAEERQERIDVKISNFHYTGTAVEFTLKMKAGAGYVPNSPANGRWGALNIYIEIYPEAGVLLDTENATNDAVALNNFDIIFASTVYTNNPGGLVPGTVPFGINLSRTWTGANDITNEYGVAANYRIPLKPGSTAPTSATRMVIRERINDLGGDWNTVFASLWSNQRDAQPHSGPIKSEKPAYHIETGCPTQALWIGGVDGDWFDSDNWVNPLVAADPLPALGMVPGSCTKVFIPGSGYRGQHLGNVNPIRNFPVLTSTNAKCNEIVFFQGGQVGRIDLLTYEKARVQLSFPWDGNSWTLAMSHNTAPDYYFNFAKGYSADDLTPGSWHMLSMPLQGVVSGDLAYGGYPFTFMRKFDVMRTGNGRFEEGEWSTSYTETDEGLGAGEGFAYFVYSRAQAFSNGGLSYFNNDSENKAGAPYGLDVTAGVIELPTYDNAIALRSHRMQEYNPATKVSTFHEVGHNEAYLGRFTGEVASTKTRSDNDTKFMRGSDPSYISYSIRTNPNYVLVGNPYMSALDFDAFADLNWGTALTGINRDYQIWNGSSFDSYVSGGVSTAGMTKYIPPMQGFFIKTRNSGSPIQSTANVIFYPEVMSTVVPFSQRANVKLRNTDEEQDIIRLSTQHGDKTSRAVIALKADATPGFVNDEDVTKLFSSAAGYPDVPEVYTLADGTALSINFVNNTSVTIPIGIRVPASGTTTLTLTGMNGYAAEKIEFVDAVTGEVTDITGRNNFEITFANEQSGYQDGRFSLRIARSTTGWEDATIAEAGIQIYKSEEAIQVVSSPGDPIKQVRIYDLQGRMLYSNTDVNTDVYSVTEQFAAEQILVVQAVTEKNTESAKIKN